MAREERSDNAPFINQTPQGDSGMDASDEQEFGGIQRSTAPDASFDTGAGEGATGYDSPVIGSQTLGNTDVEGPEHAEPYFPPGAREDGDTSRTNDDS